MNVIETLNKTILLSENFISHYSEKEMETDELARLAMIERYGITFKNLVKLFPILENDISIDYSITLLLRAALLDTHIIFYLTAINLDEGLNESQRKDKVKDEIEKLFINQLEYFLTDMERIKPLGFLSESEYNAQLSGIVGKYRFCFNDEIDMDNPKKSLKTYNNYTSPTRMYEYIIKNPLLKGIAISHFYFSIFSKIEHFGILTYSMTRTVNSKMIIEQCIEVLLVGLEYSMSLVDYTKQENIELCYINSAVHAPNFKWTW